MTRAYSLQWGNVPSHEIAGIPTEMTAFQQQNFVVLVQRCKTLEPNY